MFLEWNKIGRLHPLSHDAGTATQPREEELRDTVLRQRASEQFVRAGTTHAMFPRVLGRGIGGMQ